MNNLYEIIGNLLAAFVVGLLAALVPKAKAWFEANTGEHSAAGPVLRPGGGAAVP